MDMVNQSNFYEVDEMKKEFAELIGVEKDSILELSGKTGSGVKELLETIVAIVPSPKEKGKSSLNGRALVFDSFYDNHKGAVASIRVCNGIFKHTDDVYLVATETRTKIKEIGKFFPEMKAKSELNEGEIGYIATGIKDTEKIKIGDTVVAISGVGHSKSEMAEEALKGYEQPKPVIFVSFYPEDSSEYDTLRHDLQKLKLNDSSLTIEPDQNEILGRGYKVGCLGRLHFEITAERLKKEYKIDVINTFPSVKYIIKTKNGETSIVKPEEMPDECIEIKEPIILLNIMFPRKYLSSVLSLQQKFRMSDVYTETIVERIRISAKMPLAELISDFDDCLKSVSEGYASFSYEMIGYETADIVRVDVLVSGEQIPGLSRFLPKDALEREARKIVDKLKDLLPKQQYAQPVQASANGRIIARADIPAVKKELGNFGKNGGDRTRKMKLWKKQERGKKRLKERSEASIPPDVFKELLKK
jgi:GTP-binding protein LepA